MDRVWSRIKKTAQTVALERRSVQMTEAQNVILKICREEHVLSPPSDAVTYLAEEFVRFVDAAQT